MPSGAHEERCKHGEVAAWCGESACMAARTGLPERVWRTERGNSYHRRATCQALTDGHRLAGLRGQEAHIPECVPLADALSASLGPCSHCFPSNVALDAKRCQVRIAGSWRDAYLLEWRRDQDGRWKGLVDYRDGAGRRRAVKDQDDLRPAD